MPPVDPRAEDDLGAQATRDLRPGTDDATVRTLSASQSPFDVIGVKVVRSREKTQYDPIRARASPKVNRDCVLTERESTLACAGTLSHLRRQFYQWNGRQDARSKRRPI